MHINYLALDKTFTDFSLIKEFIQKQLPVKVTDAAVESIQKCRDYLDSKIASSDASFYGINTGFGYLQHVRIENEDLENLQNNLLMSHACGMGEEVPAEIVKLMMALKIKSLSYGHSGVQVITVKRLADMLNAGILPVVYTQGSLGASGDLAPLSHLCLPLIGMGEVWYKGEKMHAEKALELERLERIHLQSKEGLALINGTQFMSAYGLYILTQAERLFNWANAIAAISFDAFDCNMDPFHPNIHAVRPHEGQIKTAERFREMLADSMMCKREGKQTQDPYSFRCIPQVHGASYDAMEYVKSVFIREINSVTDNPNIFPDDDLIVSGGNFHGQPLAITLDFLSIALSELGNISERRTYQLISGLRGLPSFLVKNPGLHSGFMIPQYTAAGIASENKQLCMPSSVDSIPSSNNQEDHVSMGANAATKCKRVLDNLEKILAIELFTAAQAMDLRRPMRSSAYLEKILEAYREKVSFNDADRYLHDDMMRTVEFIREPLT
jgi:histidine ammonia-lyase